jgi:hypothetical protein
MGPMNDESVVPTLGAGVFCSNVIVVVNSRLHKYNDFFSSSFHGSGLAVI